MTRITQIIDGFDIGGAERVVYELSTRLPRTEFAVEVISLSRIPPQNQRLFQQLKRAGISVVSIPKDTHFGGRLFQSLTQHLARTQPDIVHTHLLVSDVWGAYAAVRAGVPIRISTEHNVNLEDGQLKHLLKCLSHRKQNTIVAISETVQRYIERTCPASRRKISIIPNGIDVDRFWVERVTPHADDAQRAQAETRIARIAIVARLEYQKGHANFLNALPFVNAPFELHIVGDGTLRAGLEEKMRELRLEQRVHFDGVRMDVERVYQEVDIVVVPSRYEGQCIAALEAMAAGCAVLAADLPAVREYITHEQNGLLVDMLNPQHVAAQLTRLIHDAHLRHALGTAAQLRVKAAYGIEKMVNAYSDLYRSL